MAKRSEHPTAQADLYGNGNISAAARALGCTRSDVSTRIDSSPELKQIIDDARAELAAIWESELNSGKCQATGNIRWEEFRIRCESEVVTGLAPRTGEKTSAVFNVLETLVPQVATGKLQSATDIGMIPEVPKIKRPKRARKGGTSPMKGRPITTKEFERMLDKVQEALFGKAKEGEEAPSAEQVDRQKDTDETWKHLLRGLWWSGLRLDEALNLYWDRSDRLCVDLTGRRPKCRNDGRRGVGRL